MYVENKPIKVCFDAFASILGYCKRTLQRMAKKRTPDGALICDKRGRHGNHHRIPDETQQYVHNHIESLPTVTSHYSRKHYPNVRYIEGEIKSIANLYKLYIEWMETNHPGKEIVTLHFYSDVMVRHFPNVHLQKPKTDTCSTCDRYKNALKETTSAEEKKNIERDRLIHWNQAQKGYDIVKRLKSK